MKIWLLVFTIWTAAPFAHAVDGLIYEKGSSRQKLIYKVQKTDTKEGNKEIIEFKFTDPQSGKVILEEKAILEDDKFTKFSSSSYQLNEQGEITAEGEQIHFRYTADGKTTTAKEKFVDNFVVPPTLIKYVHKNWDKLVDGKTIDVRMGVDFRKDTVGFSLFRVKEMEKESGVLVAKFKPTSFIIAALVDPIIYYFDLKTREVTSYIGRTKPKIMVNGKWKDLDAETVYQY